MLEKRIVYKVPSEVRKQSVETLKVIIQRKNWEIETAKFTLNNVN